jgi:hypothetical protein
MVVPKEHRSKDVKSRSEDSSHRFGCRRVRCLSAPSDEPVPGARPGERAQIPAPTTSVAVFKRKPGAVDRRDGRQDS